MEDIEAIKMLMARYWRSVDTKQWDTLADCFTEDATRDHPAGRLKGKNAIMEFFKEHSNSRLEWITGYHHGHNPEIAKTSETSATGKWQLFHERINTKTKRILRISGTYFDEYTKGKRGWKIKHSKLLHAFREEIIIGNNSVPD